MTVGSDTVCVPTCEPNQYLVQGPPGEYTCQDCHIDCNGCTGPSQAECIECRNVYELRQGVKVCLTSCPGNSFSDADGQCMPCHKQCIGCTGIANTDCVRCAEQSVIINGQMTCVPQCTAGQLLNTETGECMVDQ